VPARRGEQPLPVSASFAGLLPAINHKGTPSYVMRVYGPNGTAVATAPPPARRTAGGTFALSNSEPTPTQAQSAAVALRTLSGIDALIALQGIEEPVERRRRAVKHGRRALDALDELKLGLLAGTLDQGTLLRLKSVATDFKDGSGDEKLDSVLAEIDLRVAVELAKAGMS
jgi:Class II flagellar assembly regulator